jgi:hypothetical protein
MTTRTIATQRSAMNMPTGRLAIWWVLMSEIVIFGGILVSYILHRIAHPEWAEQAAYTNVHLGATNTLVLLSSSLSAVLAHAAAERGDGKRAGVPAPAHDPRRLMFLSSSRSSGRTRSRRASRSSPADSGPTTTPPPACTRPRHRGHVHHGVGRQHRGQEPGPAPRRERGHLLALRDLVWIFLFPLLYIAK